MVAAAMISISVAHTFRDCILVRRMYSSIDSCGSRRQDNLEALCIMKEVIIKRISSWSSCEPVRVCAIDLKKQFPSPLILRIANGACEIPIIDGFWQWIRFPLRNFSPSRIHLFSCQSLHTGKYLIISTFSSFITFKGVMACSPLNESRQVISPFRHNFLVSYTHWQKLSRSDADMRKYDFSSTCSGLVDILLDVHQNISRSIPSTTLHVPSRDEEREEESLLLNLLNSSWRSSLMITKSPPHISLIGDSPKYVR